MASAYLHNLLTESPEVVERYLQKIQIIGGLDPFAFQDKDLDFSIESVPDLDFSIESVPPVTNMDIVSYLVLTHSFYSREQMKAFKSLQSYKFIEAGFVVKVGTKIINDFYVLTLEFFTIKTFNRNCKIALRFHSEVIMPELFARYFTRITGTAQVIYWCIGKDVDDGRPMIKCDGDECEIQWFHFECVNLEDTPNEPWFCYNCEVDRL